MSQTVPGRPGVVDTHLQVGGRAVRVLRARAKRRGAGVPQLLVHGLAGSSVTWVEVMRGLAEHGPVVAMDLPGFGRTPAGPDDTLTVDAYVDFVVQVADELGWERFALHGNSMGGLIATLLAARHPERVERLVLVSPALPPRLPLKILIPSRATLDTMLPIACSSLRMMTLGAVGMAGPELGERRNRQLLGLIYSDPDGVDRGLLDLLAADFADDGDEGAAERRRATLTALRSIAAMWTDPRRVWRAIGAVTAPTLVLGGTRDALVPVRVLREVLARRPDWDGELIDDRRHALMLEDPDAYLAAFERAGRPTPQVA